MPIEITCPDCKKALRVPEDLFGQRVQCPYCNVKFTAESASDSPPPVRPAADAHGEPPPRRRPQPRYDEAEREEIDEPGPARRSREPHRGTLILTFGILGLVICAPLGIAAWVMGNTDLEAMRRGRMDRSGEGTTQAGRICGMIATLLWIVGCVLYAGAILFFGVLGVHAGR